MIRMRPLSLLAGALIVGAMGYSAFDSPVSPPQQAAMHGKQGATQHAAGDPKDARQFFDAVAGTPAGPANGEAPRAGEQWREMARKFDNATSLRAFFYEAIQHPEQGGYFYAMAALGRCRDSKAVNPTDVATPQQRAAYALGTRCDFSEQEARDAFQQMGAIRGTRLDDDPLLRQVFAFTRAKTGDEKIRVVASTMDLHHPQAIRSVITPAVEKAFGTGPGADAHAAELAGYSLDLVECRLGASCGETSDRTLELCARQGWCADSVPNALRLGLGADFARVSSESSAVFKHLSTRNFRVLVPEA